MSFKVRPFVVNVTHAAGCRKYKCGPECVRTTSGWEVDLVVRLPSGQVHRERRKAPVTSKSGAQAWARKREMVLALHGADEPISTVKEVPTVSEFAEQFMTYSKTNNKPSTVYAKEWMLRLHILPFFGAMKLNKIGPAQVEAYKAQKLALSPPLHKKTIENHLTALRKLLNLAVEWEVIDKAPRVRGFRLKPELLSPDEFLTFEEADRLIAAAKPEWKCFLLVAIRTGLRLGELLGLKWEDLDLVAGQLVVRRTVWSGQEGPPKGGSNRTVPLSDETVAALKAHRHLRGPYVFCDDRGVRLTHAAMKNVVPSACARAGLAKRVTAHGLRHTFASHLVMRGKSEKTVMDLLGHESIEMTLRYTHLTPDVKREAVQSLDAPPPRAGQPTEAAGEMLETERG